MTDRPIFCTEHRDTWMPCPYDHDRPQPEPWRHETRSVLPPSPGWANVCAGCGQDFPCDAEQMRLDREVQRLRAERAEAAFAEWGQHDAGCPPNDDPDDRKCWCGFEAARNALSPADRGTP